MEKNVEKILEDCLEENKNTDLNTEDRGLNFLQKGNYDKLQDVFSGKKILKFLNKINNKFPDKEIYFGDISENIFEFNLKNFDDFFIKCVGEIGKKNFSKLNIFIKNEKKYLEIINCDLILDFGDEKIIHQITLQSDEFLKSIS